MTVSAGWQNWPRVPWPPPRWIVCLLSYAAVVIASLAVSPAWAAGPTAPAQAPCATAPPPTTDAPAIDLLSLPETLSADAQRNVLAKYRTTEAALLKAGFLAPSVSIGSNGNDVLVAVALPANRPLAGGAELAARVVWATFADRVDRELVLLQGQPQIVYDRAQLLAAFGSRPADFDQDTQGADFYKSALGLGVLLLDVLAVGITVFVIVSRGLRSLPRVHAVWESQLAAANATASEAGAALTLYIGLTASALWLMVQLLSGWLS